MAYEFKRLSEVELVEEFPEGASALIEDNGEIKRCPSVKGSGNEPMIFHLTMDMDAGTVTAEEETTWDELYEAVKSGVDVRAWVTIVNLDPEMTAEIAGWTKLDLVYDITSEGLRAITGMGAIVVATGAVAYGHMEPDAADSWFIFDGK